MWQDFHWDEDFCDDTAPDVVNRVKIQSSEANTSTCQEWKAGQLYYSTIVPSPLGDWPCASDCPVIPNISQMPQTCQAFWLSPTHRYCKNKVTLHSSELIIQRRLYSLLIQRMKNHSYKNKHKESSRSCGDIWRTHKTGNIRQTDRQTHRGGYRVAPQLKIMQHNIGNRPTRHTPHNQSLMRVPKTLVWASIFV